MLRMMRRDLAVTDVAHDEFVIQNAVSSEVKITVRGHQRSVPIRLEENGVEIAENSSAETGCEHLYATVRTRTRTVVSRY